jgi:4-alpha-glucanotransferase
VSDRALRDLARQAGIAVEWTSAAGLPQQVAPDILRRILDALNLPCGTAAELTESRERLRLVSARDSLPAFVTATVGEPIVLPHGGGRAAGARLILEDGTRQDVAPANDRDRRLVLDAIRAPGYHELHIGDRIVTLAVAPTRCFSFADIEADARLWGLAVQLYGLRRAGDCGIGDAGGVAACAAAAARYGADAIALSPGHALFGAEPSRYQPYSPSSRLFLNPLYADPSVLFGRDKVGAALNEAGLADEAARLEATELVDWPAATAAKLAGLRRLFEDFLGQIEHRRGGTLAGDFAAFRTAGGDLLEQHARFEALHAARLAADRETWHWRGWPAEWQDPYGAGAETLAETHAPAVTFHVFLQWVASRSWTATQQIARRAGMRIGLIADLAVGMDSGGSHAWSRPRDLLVGLNIGAPPDLFNQLGQNWGLTAFSPQALTEGGFAPFLATLRAAMRHAGGVRIDHAMGLERLWLVPEGASPDQGAYLRYPVDDLLRLVRLESFRHQAVVIAEDLGTVPGGFRAKLDAAGIAGMRVLWFERDKAGFHPPDAWAQSAVAMTTTHDLPTVAGWWSGADIDTRARLDRLGHDAGAVAEKRQRDIDRKLLWRAFCASGAATAEEPAPEDPARAVDAAVEFVARTPSQLALLPLEDALGLPEQPNIPGTVAEHPNWRRRYAPEAGRIFDAPEVAARARSLSRRGRR